MAFSDDNQNFFRLYYVLIKFGTKALNELLRFLVHKTSPSATTLSRFLALPQVQSDLCPTRTRGYLDPMQKELLYPSGVPSTTIDYGDLDITLVTILLKNLTVFSGLLYQPCNPAYCSRTLWTNPTDLDLKSNPLEAYVVLLKRKRNEIAHYRKPSLPTITFQADFDQVKSWVMKIMDRVGSAAFSEDDIDKYREGFLLPEVFQETVTKLLESVEEAQELQDEVKRLIERQAQTEERLQNQIVMLTNRVGRMMNYIVLLIFSHVVAFVDRVWNAVIRFDLEQVKNDIEELKRWVLRLLNFRTERKDKFKNKHKVNESDYINYITK